MERRQSAFTGALIDLTRDDFRGTSFLWSFVCYFCSASVILFNCKVSTVASLSYHHPCFLDTITNTEVLTLLINFDDGLVNSTCLPGGQISNKLSNLGCIYDKLDQPLTLQTNS